MREITKDLIEKEEMELYQTALDLKTVVKTLVSGMLDGSQKMSASLLKESTNTLRNLSALLFNIKQELQRKEEAAQEAADNVDGMTDDERELLEDWESETDEDGNIIPPDHSKPVRPEDESLTTDPLNHIYHDKHSLGFGKAGERL